METSPQPDGGRTRYGDLVCLKQRSKLTRLTLFWSRWIYWSCAQLGKLFRSQVCQRKHWSRDILGHRYGSRPPRTVSGGAVFPTSYSVPSAPFWLFHSVRKKRWLMYKSKWDFTNGQNKGTRVFRRRMWKRIIEMSTVNSWACRVWVKGRIDWSLSHPHCHFFKKTDQSSFSLLHTHIAWNVSALNISLWSVAMVTSCGEFLLWLSNPPSWQPNREAESWGTGL